MGKNRRPPQLFGADTYLKKAILLFIKSVFASVVAFTLAGPSRCCRVLFLLNLEITFNLEWIVQ